MIHTDFERGFIRAEVIAFDDYIAGNGEAGRKEAGKLRLEGQGIRGPARATSCTSGSTFEGSRAALRCTAGPARCCTGSSCPIRSRRP